MQHSVLARFDFAGIDPDGSSRVDKNYSSGGVRFAGNLRIFLVHRPAQFGYPVVEEVVGLGLEGVRSDCDDRVGKFSVLVAIVQFATPISRVACTSEL